MYKRKKVFLESFRESLGIIAPACRASNINRQTYYNWLKRDEDFKSAVEIIQEEQIDHVESKFIESINSSGKGAVVAQIFYLKTKGKHRGFIEKIENDISGSLTININRKIINGNNK